MTDQKINGAAVSTPALSYADLFVDADVRQHGGWVPVAGYPSARIKVKGWFSVFGQSVHQRLLSERPAHLIENTDQYDAARAASKTEHAADLAARVKMERREALKELVLDWDGFSGIPFSQKNLAIVCDNESAGPFRDMLFNAALSVGKFSADDDAEKLKNFVVGLGISFDSPESTPTKSTT